MSIKKHEEIFGKNILRLRIERKLTQVQMAEILDISVRSLRMLEKGVTPKRLSCKIIFDIFDEFGENPKDMFNWNNLE